MPVLIESSEFTDVFGNSLSYYQGNTCDRFVGRFNVASIIQLSSVNNPLSLNTQNFQITSSAVSWLDEGFRVGDWVYFRLTNQNGNQIGQGWSQIDYVDDFICDLPFFLPQLMPNVQNNEQLTFTAVTGNGSTSPRPRADLECAINHIQNSLTLGEFSLIDGEATRVIFNNVETLLPGNTINGITVGNQSGQFLYSASITRNNNNNNGWPAYSIDFDFAQSGGYDAAWFQSSDCLKIFMKVLWSSIQADPYARAEAIYNWDANTGQWDEAHNSSIFDSQLVSGVSELQYCSTQNDLTVAVDGPTVDIGIGAMYIPDDTDYYTNRPFPQQVITMLLPTTEVSLGVYNSELNEFGAGFSIEITAVNTVGSVTTITFNWTPNAAFNTFFDGREDGDRGFKLWVKCGNVNHLAFNDQLTCDPPVGGPLIMEQDYGYFDHSSNVQDITGDQIGFIADTEDDVAYLGRFLLTKGEVNQSFTARIEAYNTVTQEDFTLESVSFGFAGVPYSNDGRHLLNESTQVVTTLPNTSVKRNATLVLDPSLDTPTQYGVKIYAPWLLDWRYWIPLVGASVDFWPTQNRNWEQYDNLGDWTIRTTLILVRDNLSYTHSNQITINPYDNEDNIDSEIELLYGQALTPINVIPENEILRIKSTHTKLSGNWDQSLTWGMITIEPNESNQRSICSSVIPFDGNISNPLTPLSGNVIAIQYPQPNVAVLECEFDSSKISLISGCDITAKIKENEKPLDSPILTEPREAEFAFSLRKVSTNSVYPDASPCIRVRRSSDNAELDVGFVGSPLAVDTASALAFAGASELYVVTVYDQSGNNNHATNSTASEQQRVAFDGAFEVLNGKPCFNANPGTLKAPLNLTNQGIDFDTSFSVARVEVINSINYIAGAGNANGIFYAGTNSGYDGFGIQAGVTFSLSGEDTNQHLGYSNRRSGNAYLAVDGGAEVNTGAAPVSNMGTVYIGGKKLGTNLYLRGQWQEIIVFADDRSADKVAIENNINNFYQIY